MSFVFNTCLRILELKFSLIFLLNSFYVILNLTLIMRIRILVARNIIIKKFSNSSLLISLSVI